MKKLFLILITGLLISSCVPSLHPLYTDEDLVFEPQLIGKWVEEAGQTSYEFISDDSINYTLIYTEDSTPSNFTAHLIKLGDYLFMDILPEEPEFGNEFYKGYLLPVHSFYKVIMENNMLRLDGLDGEWIKSELENGNIKIAHEILDGEEIILTASSKDLQNLIVAHADNDEAFPEGSEAYREK